MTLHLLNKAPDHPRFSACLQAIAPDDCLLLMENAVHGITVASLELPAATRVLAADARARGLAEPAGGVKFVDYDGMVRLTEAHSRIISW